MVDKSHQHHRRWDSKLSIMNLALRRLIYHQSTVNGRFNGEVWTMICKICLGTNSLSLWTLHREVDVRPVYCQRWSLQKGQPNLKRYRTNSVSKASIVEICGQRSATVTVLEAFCTAFWTLPDTCWVSWRPLGGLLEAACKPLETSCSVTTRC